MSPNGSESLIAALGIGVDAAPVPDDLWNSMLSVAFDPDAPVSDGSIVPEMDDSGDLPDDSDDGVVTHASTDHDDSAQHDDSTHHVDHDADALSHDSHDTGAHDSGTHYNHTDPHHGDTDWHV